MNFIRKILFPFAVLYGVITSLRNILYDSGFFKSTSFHLPVIAVGNLSVGGTGKTPQIEYLIRLLSDRYQLATLSRGYKRKSKGFVLADAYSNASVLGDEPYQFHQKFPQILVAVDSNRVNGIQQLLGLKNAPEIILLDDAFQHRKVKAGFYILLTAYSDLYCDDFILPMGNLRESRKGSKRADVIIVTKCPPNLSQEEQERIRKKLKLNTEQQLFFTYIDYDSEVTSNEKSISVEELKKQEFVLLAGIAKPDPFFNYLKTPSTSLVTFPDHHDFTREDIQKIRDTANGKLIVTTEKDFVRLKGKFPMEQLYYLPIRTAFINRCQTFDQTILEYVGTSARNS